MKLKPGPLGRKFLKHVKSAPFRCGFCGEEVWYPLPKVPINRPVIDEGMNFNVSYLPMCISCMGGKEFKNLVKKIKKDDFTPKQTAVLRGENIEIVDLTDLDEE